MINDNTLRSPTAQPQIVADFCALVSLSDPTRVTLHLGGRPVAPGDPATLIPTTPRTLLLPDLPPSRRVLVARLRPLPRDRLAPLHLAAEHGHEAVVELLLQSGADTRAADSDGRRPIDVARKLFLCFASPPLHIRPNSAPEPASHGRPRRA